MFHSIGESVKSQTTLMYKDGFAWDRDIAIEEFVESLDVGIAKKTKSSHVALSKIENDMKNMLIVNNQIPLRCDLVFRKSNSFCLVNWPISLESVCLLCLF